MSLVKRLFEIGKSAPMNLFLAGVMFFSSLMPLSCAPDDSSPKKKDKNTKSYITSVEGADTWKAGDNYDHDAEGNDNEGDPFTFGLNTDAPFLTIDPVTGLMSGVPQASDIGQTYFVELSIDDGISGPNYQSWPLTITKADNPVITTSGPTDTAEGYNCYYDADANDPKSHPLTWSLGTAPAGATINSATGEFNWTPTIGQERQNNALEIIVSNAYGGSATESLNPYTRGREPITNMTVEDLHTGFPAENAVVTITTTYDTYVSNPTDALGNVTGLDNVVDGTHNMNVTCTNYYTSNQNIEVSEAKQVAGKLDGLTYEVVNNSFDMDLFDRCYRSYDGDTFVGAGNGKSQRPTDADAANWTFNIDTSPAVGSGVTITQTMIDNMRDAIDNDFTTMSRGKLNCSNVNVAEDVDFYGTPLTTHCYWNDSLGAGHAEGMDGNNVKYAGLHVKTSSTIRANRHEEFQSCFGCRHDDTIPEAKKPLTILGTATDFTTWDVDSAYYNYSIHPGSTSPDNRTGLVNE
jgi:hypothetical protein